MLKFLESRPCSVRTCLDLERLFEEYKLRLLPASMASSVTRWTTSEMGAPVNALAAVLIGVLLLLLFRSYSVTN
jgi:hypothetical protein